MTGLEAALRERGVETELRILTDADQLGEIEGADAIVLDSYRSPTVIPGSIPIAVMYDGGSWPDDADLVLDGAVPANICLRPEFWDLPPREIGRVGSVLVAAGAGGEQSVAFAGAVRTVLPSSRIVLVRGPYSTSEPPEGVEVAQAPDSLAVLLRDADLAVLAAGQTMLEAAAAGTPTVAVVVVENQRRQAERLAELGAVVLAEERSVSAEVAALALDHERRRALSKTAQETVDGQGARRIAALVEQLA
jgi:hypothetical protein